MRRRRSSRSSSGTSTRKGRTAGWVSIGCTPHPVERLGMISPAVLHNEVKCEVLEGLAQLPRTPFWRSSHSGDSPKLDFHFTEFSEVHIQIVLRSSGANL